MPNELWIAIVGAGTALAGAIAGYIASAVQASKAFEREVEKERRHRNLALRDFSRNRRLTVRDRRCDQAEEFVTNMTEDFHQFRTQAIWIAAASSGEDLPADFQEYAFWQKHIDRTAYQYGPVISAISSKRHDLTKPWMEMEQGWKDMSAHYQFAYVTRIENHQAIPDQEQLHKAIDDVYSAYNDGRREFIVTIDKLRASRLR